MARSSSPSPWDYAAALLVAAPLFWFLAGSRLVDDDEGYYALAGRAMVEGRIPYRDFFFPQLPLSAAVYGAVRVVLGPGLVPLRLFAALLGVGTTLLVHHAARREGGRTAGLVASALFAAHTLTWEWAPTVKTFPVGLFLAVAALVVATSGRVTGRTALAAGFLAGLAVSARALGAPVVVGVAVALHRLPERRALFLRAAVGLGVALLPVVVLAAMDPAAFWFDNVGYHAIRSPGLGLVKDATQKLLVAREAFLTPFGATRPDVTGLQTMVLVVGVALASRRARPDPAAGSRNAPFAVTALLTALLAFLPSPAWVQYLAAAVPPASVVVGSWCARFARPPWLVAAGAVLYSLAAGGSFRDRIVRAPALFRPAAVDAVGRSLDSVTPEGAAVAAHFPAYLVASGRRLLPGAENQFARLYSERLGAKSRARYHLLTEEDFRGALLRREARTFVVGAFTVPETALALKSAGWTRVADVPGATLWGAPGSDP